jgi:hypothetical protein
MTESELKEALKKYQEAKLKEIDEMVDQMEEHEFSPRFQRRIKKLFWSERYFGSRITLGLVMRKVAMIAIILTSLVVAGQVSARVFHFHPWESFSFFGKQEESGENKTGEGDTSHIVSVEDDDFVPEAKKEKKKKKKEEKLKNQLDQKTDKAEQIISNGATSDADKPVEKVKWEKMESDVKKGDLTYTIRMSQDTNKVWITKITFSGDSVEKIQIPEEFDDAPVVRIGKPGKGNEYYTVVGTTVCPDNNKDGEYSDLDGEDLKSASKMKNVKEIVLPDTVERLEEGSFSGFKNLEKINLPDGIKSLTPYLFYGCYHICEFGLEGINSHYKNENDFIIKKSTGDILYAPLGLSNMKVPEGVRTLPKYFLRYSSVKKISLPKSLASIGNYALDGPELESISLDEGNKKYKERMGCIVTSNEKRLVAVASETGIISIPEKVTSLGAGISMGKRGSLKRILIPKSVKKLKKGWQSLYLCSHSEDVELRFLSEEPPTVELYEEFSEEDETGEQQTFSGEDMVLDNPVTVPKEAEDAYSTWDYELPDLTSR